MVLLIMAFSYLLTYLLTYHCLYLVNSVFSVTNILNKCFAPFFTFTQS